MWRIKKTIFVIFIAAALLTAGCGKQAAPAAAPETKKIPVGVVTVKKSSLEKRIPLGGLVQPQDEVALAAKNPSAKILQVPVRVGDSVQAGTPLVIFDSRDTDLQLEQARLNYERNKQLYESGAVSKSQLEQLETTYENLKLQKEYLTLTSPVDGLVSSVSAVEGQLAGATALVSVVNINKVKLQVQVGEANINKLKLGEEMEVSVPAASGEPFTGVVTIIAPQMDSRTKAYPVTLEIPNEEALIKGGMYAEVQLTTERKDGVITVPQYAVIDSEQQKVVYVVESDTAKMREVKLGLTLGDQAEVVEGLAEGEMLIVEGQYGVKDGSAVAPTARSEGK